VSTSDTRKVAVVRGGSSGIGFAIAQKMAAQGMRVIITARRRDALDRAVTQLGGDAVGIVADVSSTAGLEALFSEIKTGFGSIHTLVANAGGGVHAALAGRSPKGPMTSSSIRTSKA
jgi:NAD(P)-dependent dehydrogenase (short-subunit alcohol dehydrogenase family)